MRLALIGGGGFRVPLVYRALQGAKSSPVAELCLFDTDRRRLDVVAAVLRRLAHEGCGPALVIAQTLDDALTRADVVFSAVRVGGLAGRVADERVAIGLGVLGQETVGPGGLAFGLRTVPVAVRLAQRIADLAPNAWTINFTNPAGLITEAMQGVLGGRVVGICDSPIGLVRRCAAAVGRRSEDLRVDYAGLNHLGWLQGLWDGEHNLIDDLLADQGALASIEEGRLFGAARLRELGAIPNEYLHYYEHPAPPPGRTRGEFLAEQQEGFYREAAAARDPLAVWRRVHRERDETYLQESRAEGETRAAEDVSAGGYEGVALAIMGAVAGGPAAEVIVNTANRGTLPGLPDDAVVEVPSVVDRAGVHPRAVTPLAGEPLSLVQRVKECERLVIRAALTGDTEAAEQAFARHPLVASDDLGRKLLSGYRRAIPEVDALFC